MRVTSAVCVCLSQLQLGSSMYYSLPVGPSVINVNTGSTWGSVVHWDLYREEKYSCMNIVKLELNQILSGSACICFDFLVLLCYTARWFYDLLGTLISYTIFHCLWVLFTNNVFHISWLKVTSFWILHGDLQYIYGEIIIVDIFFLIGHLIL